jgi:hypothetical protein
VAIVAQVQVESTALPTVTTIKALMTEPLHARAVITARALLMREPLYVRDVKKISYVRSITLTHTSLMHNLQLRLLFIQQLDVALSSVPGL